MTTDSNSLRQRILDEAPVWETEFAAGPGLVVSVSDAVNVVQKMMTEDALLASVMRKILASSGYINWGRFSADYPYSITVDVNEVVITAEEMQAIDDAAPSS